MCVLQGGNLPFRRLCADFGAEATMSEMAFARMLLKGDRKEAATLRRAANEQLYGGWRCGDFQRRGYNVGSAGGREGLCGRG